MYGSNQYGQFFYGQGYPAPPGESPGRYGIDVFGTDGSLVVRIGDISGMPWGGSDYTLLEGTYGLWGKRNGIWIKAMTQMFYANCRLHTITDSVPLTINLTGTHRVIVVVDEAFPFGTIKVPKGRVVTLEWFWHKLSGTWSTSPASTFLGVVLESQEFRGSLNGGAETTFDFLSGPTTGGENTYTGLKARLTYNIGFSTTWTGSATGNYTIARVATIRLFSHEVNANTVVSVVSETVERASSVGADPSGDERTGRAGTDQGGGSGTDDGGYGGDLPGGGGPVV